MASYNELCNVDAEAEVISALMSKPNKFHDISRILKVDDFYRETNRLIYQTMARMIISNEPLDMTNLSEKLKQEGNLEKVGGLAEIFRIGKYALPIRIESQAQIIAEYARRRRLVEKAKELAIMAADTQNDVDEVAFNIANDLSGMTATADDNTKTAKDGTLELAALIDQRAKRKGELLNTGLRDVDGYLTALEAGQLIVIAGRPAHGKTALAGTIAVNLAKRGKKVLMFSMEMSREELLGRFVSRFSGLSSQKLKTPNEMTPEEWNMYFKGMEEVSELPIVINAQGSLSPADVANIATRWQRQHGIDVIMIDYLQLMNSGHRADNRVNEISYITRTLKNLAVSLKIPIVVLSQLNRSNDRENRPPKLTDLRDSGSIEQDANTVLLIHRESRLNEETNTEELTNKTYVNIAKQRDGGCGTVLLTFIPSRGFFANYIDEGSVMSKNFKPPL